MSKLNQILFPSEHQKPAVLVLSDGTIYHGLSIGIDGKSVAEIVFNTAMTGYQEILSDPSYAEQMVTLTYPHIGNTGTNAADNESAHVYAKGLIVRDYAKTASNFRNEENLQSYLIKHNVVAISDVDTRALTNKLRVHGSMSACIMSGEVDVDEALKSAQAYPGLAGLDLAKVVSCEQSYQWEEGTYSLEQIGFKQNQEKTFKVVCYDFGVKRNILRILDDLGCDLTVVPAETSAETVMAMKPDGVFLSNGPGDPAACDYAIAACQAFLQNKVPLFGICLGHQIMALALGAKTMKMKFGHHGANHPVENCDNKTVLITSQNHNFAVADENLPETLSITHRSLFDGSIQGIKHKHLNAYGFQGHPEASPGPHEAKIIFEPFIQAMKQESHNG
ncbi:glutamine-hydrolyzing carbamoyl-phosphate synthase small subunit [Marinicella litoralis]|uniref:Carbamoyl phosphate synthase small chain n=1 Tax=Marinicella litoralis TaxID=644220 RepID=A0A4R6XW72_9GAMM|nr:glutamine-hydrolyzing carbamoyl-phosphate synthase small subunit [Marinicella litoralis]TDR22377.1 carbamoyl-phosphate synthase small subunit [Marinicella litoralis]